MVKTISSLQTSLFSQSKDSQLIAFYNGVEISRDKEGRLSLTALWKSAGSKREQAPNFWINQDSTKQLLEVSCGFLNATQDCIMKSKRGKNGGTYAHKQIALAYAKYLNPELHYAVNQAFFERLEQDKNPELAIDQAYKSWERQGRSLEWITTRVKGLGTRKAFTKILKTAGVVEEGYKDCTNAIYTPIFGGSASEIRLRNKLPEKANLREHLSEIELAAVELAEMIAADNIKRKSLWGNEACESECKYTSLIIASSINQAQALSKGGSQPIRNI